MSDGGSAKETARALLDPCSEATLITLHLARRLGYKLQRTDIRITGVAGSIMDSARHRTDVYFIDPTDNRPKRTEAFVLRTINIVTPSGTPASRINRSKCGLNLADPLFDKARKVDIVLGADVYKSVLLAGVRNWGPLLAQQTIFGWTMTGSVLGISSVSSSTSSTCITMTSEANPCHEKLLSLVQRFWAVEEVPQVKRLSAADVECEAIYKDRVRRDPEGRYVVPLLVDREKISSLGESLEQARASLASTHRRMQRDSELDESYRKFMREYEQLGHMRPLTRQELMDYDGPSHYITHHGIWQRSDEGKKLRVVFNASRSTTSGRSLNDIIYAGPKLQNHIATILTLWRRHRYAFCADVKMMFRQIRMDPRDIHLQRILWSPSADEPARHYVLLTVTYGTASAPYLALRTLKQLCADEGARFPQAAEAVESDLYVDDFLTGASDLESARRLRDQLSELLTAGGFCLKKWVTNDRKLLTDISAADRLRPNWVNFSTEGPVNELGMAWDPVSDTFKFRVPPRNPDTPLTKRKALAELARTFDPAGWLAPLTLIGKLIVQDIWRAKLDWDEHLPQPWVKRWTAFCESLGAITDISIPRWFKCIPGQPIQLHAFADASRRAMAGVLYSRTGTSDDVGCTTLVGAKTKLNLIRGLLPSPKPNRMTTPRLELRAALIAAQLLETAARILNVPMTSCHLWSDSQIVLHWLKSDGPVGNDLVDNYISHIQELTACATWHHVPTKENPADVASRGAEATGLVLHPAWWSGPGWLSKPDRHWPVTNLRADAIEECAAVADQPSVQCLVTQGTNQSPLDPASRFSSLDSLLRGTARILRWLRHKSGLPISEFRRPVTAEELRRAYLTCVRNSQRQSFASEMEQLRCRKDGTPGSLSSHSSLKFLDPFLDQEGILRVGGRLGNSALPYDAKHPVLLDSGSALARLVLRWAHERSLHGGFRATYARVLQKAWITGGHTHVKRHIRQCLVCARITARVSSQRMAPLPAARVTPLPAPFSKCGVDYAGPFSICRTKGRGMSTFKGYVAVFVCLCTKAIHLELAGDLSTASFLGVLTRFISCRGCPIEIWSDNGTTFHGADRELKRLLEEAKLDWKAVENEMAVQGITWKFIPPGAPHFGGLWEAGVKSMKAHLQRVVGPRRLTFEEFSTLLSSIAAILNSRPLVPPSGDLGDLEALTPNHFLIGSSTASFPQPATVDSEAQLDRATHWDLVRAMRDNFWERWGREYLNTLMQRPKWRTPQPNIEVGDFVVVVDPSLLLPDGRWPLGRVIQTHPGRDGLVRAATVKTAAGQYQRPVVKLARLPLRDCGAQGSTSSDRSGNEAGGMFARVQASDGQPSAPPTTAGR